MTKTLQETSWGEIAEISRQGKAAERFKVGDEKVIELYTGEPVTLVIAGFNHDDTIIYNADSDNYIRKAGITFTTKNLLELEYAMNNDWSNKGGWSESRMRNVYLQRVLKLLPPDLADVITEAQKKTAGGYCNNQIVVTNDKLWLLSEVEVSGGNDRSLKGEGAQYEYYKDFDARKKTRDGDPDWWWLRSPISNSATNFRAVNTAGALSNDSANGANGVCLGFCV